MRDTVRIYHNPRCSKSRQTLALLREQGIEPEVVEYLNEPPTEEDLRDLLKKLNRSARDIVRTKEADYTTAGLSKESSEDEIVAAIVNYPKLLERPIVVRGNRAELGRPPERILDLL